MTVINRVADRAAAQADRKAAARARRAVLADLAREALRQPFLEICEPDVRRVLARECLAAASALALTELGATEAGAALQREARKCFDGPERGTRPTLEIDPTPASLLPSREKVAGRRPVG